MKPSLLIGKDTHRELADLLKKEGELVVSGASNETAKAMLLSHILSFNGTDRTLLVTNDEESMETLGHWLRFFECETATVEQMHNDEGELIPESLHQFLLFMRGTNGKSAEKTVF